MSANVKRMRGLAIHRGILIGNTATPLSEAERIVSAPDHTHKWTVAVRSVASHPLPSISEADQLGLASSSRGTHQNADGSGAGTNVGASISGSNNAEREVSVSGTPAPSTGVSTRGRESETDYHKMVGGKDDISHFIKRVQFKLHETYPQHTRNIDKPPFQVTETGWGEFDIQIKIFFVPESGEKPISTFHRLKLHPWHPVTIPAPEVGLGNPEGSADAPTITTGANETIADTSVAEGQADTTMEDTEAGQDETQEVAGDVSVQEGETSVSNIGEATNASITAIKNEETSTPMVHETRSASAAAHPTALRPLPSVVHSWAYDEIVFPEPTESFYEVLIKHPPTPLPTQSAQAFSDPASFQRYKTALSQLDDTSGPQGRDLRLESGVLPPHPLHDSSGALFDALSQEAMQAEGERLDQARRNAVQELEETRAKLIEGERKLRSGRPISAI
ncbi:yeats-domain-containing protein [Meira miltonrushii]|uniref:Protein AF-9 homolog n=1 Tax=Meira miltonrushii TaxID=1280837 RepID=A0A316V4Q4_9BASI|nr:yeats-domain-containing protein [Meira miltonrushii]PWN31471.1 yeats-domain-containing protein [Meira miltonrushii]